MIWNYRLTTNTIWLSFDFGQVEAETKEEAIKNATNQLKEALEKVKPIGESISLDFTQIEVELEN